MSAPVASGREALQITRGEAGQVTITIDRPARMNAIDYDTLVALGELVAELGAEEATRTLVITGSGEVFTTGADLQAIGEGDPDRPVTPEMTMDAATAVVHAIVRCPVPVVAAVNGPAAGVGVSLALAADVAFMCDDAYVFFAFTGIGLMPDGGATALLAASVGRARAQRMLLGAEKVSGTEAAAIGMVAGSYPRAEFDTVVAQYVERLACGPRRALALTKQAGNAASLDALDAALAREHEGQVAQLTGPEFAEGVAALMGKRRPEFP